MADKQIPNAIWLVVGAVVIWILWKRLHIGTALVYSWDAIWINRNAAERTLFIVLIFVLIYRYGERMNMGMSKLNKWLENANDEVVDAIDAQHHEHNPLSVPKLKGVRLGKRERVVKND